MADFHELAGKRVEAVEKAYDTLAKMSRRNYSDAGDEDRQPYIDRLVAGIDVVREGWGMPTADGSAPVGNATPAGGVSARALLTFANEWYDRDDDGGALTDDEADGASAVLDAMEAELKRLEADGIEDAEVVDEDAELNAVADERVASGETVSPPDDWSADDIDAVRAAAARFGMVLVAEEPEQNDPPTVAGDLRDRAGAAIDAVESMAASSKSVVRALLQMADGGSGTGATGIPIDADAAKKAVDNFASTLHLEAKASLMSDEADAKRKAEQTRIARKTLLGVMGVQS